jgi:hypothetical protein
MNINTTNVVFIMLKSFLLLMIQISSCMGMNVVGWWVGSPDNPHFPIERLPWDIYTHIRYGDPLNHPNGTVYCNKTDYHLQKVLKLAHSHDVKVQWGCGVEDIHDVLWNPDKNYLRQNYIDSIGAAVRECGVDGIELDYEFGDSKHMNIGIVTYDESTHYSQFLADIKTAIGKDKIVSADVSIWGVAPGNWILGALPWVNATMLNRGDFDFINTMSYHWNKDGSIWSWKKDAWFIDKWGIDRKRVHIGIPYFSMNRTKNLKPYNEPSWGGLSALCPNIDPKANVCDGVVFVGKQMNEDIGRWVKEEGFGGVFPWAANYDSFEHNNTLVSWLKKGLGG